MGGETEDELAAEVAMTASRITYGGANSTRTLFVTGMGMCVAHALKFCKIISDFIARSRTATP